MNLKQLCKEAPSWKWGATRDGFGWNYYGLRNGKIVFIYPESELVSEDSFRTIWKVCHEKFTEPYNIWILLNCL